MSSLVKYNTKYSDIARKECKWEGTGSFLCPEVKDIKKIIHIDQNPVCSWRSYDSMFLYKIKDTNITDHDDI